MRRLTRPGSKVRSARRAGPSIAMASWDRVSGATTNGARISGPITGSRWISSKRSDRTVITTVTGEPAPRPPPSTPRNSSLSRAGVTVASCSAWSTVTSSRFAGTLALTASHSPNAARPWVTTLSRHSPSVSWPGSRPASWLSNRSRGRIPGSNGPATAQPDCGAASRAASPARTKEDLPAPDGPITTTRSPSRCPSGPSTRASRSRISSSRPKNTPASAMSIAASPG